MKNKNTPKIDYPVIKFKDWEYILNPFIKQKLNNGNDAEYIQTISVLTKDAKWIEEKQFYRHNWKHIFYEYTETGIKKFYIEVDHKNNPIEANYYK